MALQETQAEPSMEEILASIRRIISEEEQARAAEPVLDLTQHAETEADKHSRRRSLCSKRLSKSSPRQPRRQRPSSRKRPCPQRRSARTRPLSRPRQSTRSSPRPRPTLAAGSLARLAGSLRIADAAGPDGRGRRARTAEADAEGMAGAEPARHRRSPGRGRTGAHRPPGAVSLRHKAQAGRAPRHRLGRLRFVGGLRGRWPTLAAGDAGAASRCS